MGSYATTRETEAGKVDVGYMADIVIFSKDLHSGAVRELGHGNPAVLATCVGGRKAHSAKRGFPSDGPSREGLVPLLP